MFARRRELPSLLTSKSCWWKKWVYRFTFSRYQKRPGPYESSLNTVTREITPFSLPTLILLAMLLRLLFLFRMWCLKMVSYCNAIISNVNTQQYFHFKSQHLNSCIKYIPYTLCRGVMFIVGHGKTSSNPRRDCLLFTLILLEKVWIQLFSRQQWVDNKADWIL